MTAPARRQLAGGALLVSLMVVASLALWVGVPVTWLWVGGRVKGATGSLGAAVAVMFTGAIVSIALFVPLLGWLNHRHSELRVARGEPQSIALEAILVMTAAVAIVGFGVWFFVFAGANPFPLVNPT